MVTEGMHQISGIPKIFAMHSLSMDTPHIESSDGDNILVTLRYVLHQMTLCTHESSTARVERMVGPHAPYCTPSTNKFSAFAYG